MGMTRPGRGDLLPMVPMAPGNLWSFFLAVRELEIMDRFFNLRRLASGLSASSLMRDKCEEQMEQ
jgi:hypothetical protein